ncbi:MAG TPA: peptidase inhibitor family I36 protein [Mycobacteriales bacterium]|nr:peptidase inhibitor family I36 protein [Mycobacteriales bacterium]
MVGLATVVATLFAPVGATAAHADTASAAPSVRAELPPGVIRLNDGERCPSGTLCLYRDYGHRGPAYGIGAGYPVNLYDLPMPGGAGSASAGNTVSSWVNNTESFAILVDIDTDAVRPLLPGQRLEEPPFLNDTVDEVRWA